MPIKDSTVTERFFRDAEKHQIEVIKDDGLYRHIRLAQPGTGIMRFDLITWPGHLCYTGDMGTYVFSRVRDMFNFFRESPPNLSYWSEKVLAADKSGGIAEYSADVFEDEIKQFFEDYTSDWEDKDKKEAAWLNVKERVLTCSACGEQVAKEAAARFEVFTDFWEVDCTKYNFHFEWCCHAIPWGIAKYDEAKELQQASPLAALSPPQ